MTQQARLPASSPRASAAALSVRCCARPALQLPSPCQDNALTLDTTYVPSPWDGALQTDKDIKLATMDLGVQLPVKQGGNKILWQWPWFSFSYCFCFLLELSRLSSPLPPLSKKNNNNKKPTPKKQNKTKKQTNKTHTEKECVSVRER